MWPLMIFRKKSMSTTSCRRPMDGRFSSLDKWPQVGITQFDSKQSNKATLQNQLSLWHQLWKLSLHYGFTIAPKLSWNLSVYARKRLAHMIFLLHRFKLNLLIEHIISINYTFLNNQLRYGLVLRVHSHGCNMKLKLQKNHRTLWLSWIDPFSIEYFLSPYNGYKSLLY